MFKKVVIFFLISVGIFLLSSFALATTSTTTGSTGLISGGVQQLGSAVYGSGTTSTSLPVLIATIIKALLGLLGIIFIVIIIYAGFLYITSQGTPETIKKAKSTIFYALIGLIIILTSYALASFVTDIIINSAGITGGGGGTNSTGTGTGGIK
ncbi:MAG: hypothetical protein NTX00_00775 [Candidatus Parcubacteria bacterium]|nr:hypothetical protein [Candidatus Parcubacteria bacterium]